MNGMNDSWYIETFLKGNEKLSKALNEHQDHNYPLSKKQEEMEGKTFAYGRKDEDYIERR